MFSSLPFLRVALTASWSLLFGRSAAPSYAAEWSSERESSLSRLSVCHLRHWRFWQSLPSGPQSWLPPRVCPPHEEAIRPRTTLWRPLQSTQTGSSPGKFSSEVPSSRRRLDDVVLPP